LRTHFPHFHRTSRVTADLSTMSLVAFFVQLILIGLTYGENSEVSTTFRHLSPPQSVRQNIRDGHPDFLVTADSWPAFLYPHARANEDDMEQGLLQSAILVKVRRISICAASVLPIVFFRPSNLPSPRLHLPKILLVKMIWNTKHLEHFSVAELGRHRLGAMSQACSE